METMKWEQREADGKVTGYKTRTNSSKMPQGLIEEVYIQVKVQHYKLLLLYVLIYSF